MTIYPFSRVGHVACGFLLIALCGCSDGGSGKNQVSREDNNSFATQEALGEALFNDKNLSFDGTQSCATCHNPDFAFTDNRLDANGDVAAFSMGDDGFSSGDRNTPTAAYASFSPLFQLSAHRRVNSRMDDYQGYIGGLFVDGRAADLAAQAGGPPLNPIEMAMPDKDAVVERLMDNPDYQRAFKEFFGDNIFADVESAYDAMTASIAAFEKTELFHPFDSKYDRSLRGEYIYNPASKAAYGKALFFSDQFSNCSTCHQLKSVGHREETFTSYEYHNIGVPANSADRALFGKPDNFTDTGLLEHPDLNQENDLAGKFKVPTLRNAAVTAPYMHNGVFKSLRTVILFYEHFKDGSQFTLNPETGESWQAPETEANLNLTELQDTRHLTEDEVDALVCFIRTLTDERYEHLIQENGVVCDD